MVRTITQNNNRTYYNSNNLRWNKILKIYYYKFKIYWTKYRTEYIFSLYLFDRNTNNEKKTNKQKKSLPTKVVLDAEQQKQ